MQMIAFPKPQIVRLKGKDMALLRARCFVRDRYTCQECGYHGHWYGLDMAHIHGKRNYGDTLENVRTLCHRCHMLEHNPKSVPPKGNQNELDA
jgi:5-methylcytosine-specific restriction endonuclease McrA